MRKSIMIAKFFTRSFVTLMLIWALAPGLAFCELKTLDDHEMSEVNAKAGGLFNTEINEGQNKENKTTEFLNEYTDINGLKNTNACSSALDCAPAQNDFFSPGHQNPVRFSAPMPHCSSGGCR